jgi:hypothetical protein
MDGDGDGVLGGTRAPAPGTEGAMLGNANAKARGQ